MLKTDRRGRFWVKLLRQEGLCLPRVVRALRGWSRRAPLIICGPLPWQVMAAAVYVLASWDFMTNYGTLNEIRQRGRRNCEEFIARDQKTSKLVSAWHRIPEKYRESGEGVAENLEHPLADPTMAPAFSDRLRRLM